MKNLAASFKFYGSRFSCAKNSDSESFFVGSSATAKGLLTQMTSVLFLADYCFVTWGPFSCLGVVGVVGVFFFLPIII